MTLQAKFRVLLAVFGVSVVANVMVSVWCIRVYIDNAIAQFARHMSGATQVELVRSAIGTLLSDLMQRPDLSTAERTDDFREQCDEIEQAVGSLGGPDGTDSGARVHARLIELSRDLRSACQRYVAIVDASRLEEAAEFLRTKIMDGCARRLHQLLATVAISHNQALTQTTAEIEQTRSAVTALLSANAVAAFLLSAVGVLLVRNWVLRPVESLTRAAREHAQGNLHYRIEQHAQDELGTLSRAVNRMADSLLDIQKRLVQQERLAALGEVASTVAHNIRNPLAGIRASAQSMLGDLEQDSPAYPRHLRIVETVDSLNRWVKQLLLLNQPLELQCRRVPVREIVDAVLTAQRSNAERCRVRFSYPPPEDGCRVYVDPRHIEQAVQIVVDNAIDASPPESEISITARCADEGQRWVHLTVRDRGPGIPADVRDRIASPYFTTKPGGTGIGLYLAKKAVESHGGEILFESPPSGGTAVVLRLPARDLFGAVDGEDSAGG